MRSIKLSTLFITFLLACYGTFSSWSLETADNNAAGNSKPKHFLLSSAFSGSYVESTSAIGGALLSRGHHVTYLMINGSKHVGRLRERGFNVFEVGRPSDVAQHDDCLGVVNTDVYMGSVVDVIKTMKVSVSMMRCLNTIYEELCHSLLANEQRMAELNALNIDYALLDSFPTCRCFYSLPLKLDIPYSLMSTLYLPWMVGVLVTPNANPVQILPFTDRMSFWQRSVNALPYMLMQMFMTLTNDKMDFELDSDLWLFFQDPLLDYPKPITPNGLFIGGVTTRPGQPLEAEMNNKLNGILAGRKGFVVVSFGSVLFLHSKHLQPFFRVFSAMSSDYAFVMRHNSSNLSEEDRLLMPPNLIIKDWLPQNDLMAHPKCLAIVTHCGNNGQWEAVYHSVPIVGVPIFAEQFGNAKRMEVKGYGIWASLNDPEDSLQETIRTVLTNDSYRENIKRASEIFHSREHPTLRAADALISATKFGVSHLKPASLEQPFYIRWMLDVFAVSMLALFVSFWILRLIIRCCWWAVHGVAGHSTRAKVD